VNVEEDSIWEFDSAGCSIPAALQQLAEALAADETPDQTLPRNMSANGGVSLQSEALTPRTLCTAIVSLQPEGAIVVDESLTSGSSYWELSEVFLPSLLQSPLGVHVRKHLHAAGLQQYTHVLKRKVALRDRGSACRRRLRSPI